MGPVPEGVSPRYARDCPCGFQATAGCRDGRGNPGVDRPSPPAVVVPLTVWSARSTISPPAGGARSVDPVGADHEGLKDRRLISSCDQVGLQRCRRRWLAEVEASHSAPSTARLPQADPTCRT